MPEPQYAAANGLQIAYETFGDRSDPPLVLIMGLGTQMIAWPDSFCEALAEAGHWVVRFDNRDIGLSTHLDHLPKPSPVAVAAGRTRPAYTVTDMAKDTLGLLDALEIERADLVGASMGGYIAQTVALRAPERVRTLTLIMTSTGSRRVGQPSPRLIRSLLERRRVRDRDSARAAGIATFKLIGSPGFAFDDDYLGDVAARSYDRGYNPAGYVRQLGAATRQRNRTDWLRRLQVPTLVMHGLADRLVAPSGGMALASTIPGAVFVGFNGMGHDLPRALWPSFIAQITRHTAAESADETVTVPA